MRNLIFILLTLFLMYPKGACAQTYDFNKSGNDSATEILTDFVQNEIEDFKGDVIGYYYDIENDDCNEILGIIKSQFFYGPEGYKLFVLKNTNGSWNMLNSDVNFDPTQKFIVKNNKITYYKTIYYKNKKYKAKIKNGNIKTVKTPSGYLFNKKADKIAKASTITQGSKKNEIELAGFSTIKQRSVNISYPNLRDKTKHYLDMK